MRTTLILFFLFLSFSSFGQRCKQTTVYFKSGKYNLTNSAVSAIDSVLQSLYKDSTYVIEVQGHTDKMGADKKNQILARNRMMSVVNYISKYKLPNVVVIYDSYGESRPLSDDLSKNRRVTISVLRINPDKTISIKDGGAPSVDLKVPASYFNNCGICDTFPKLKSRVQESPENPGGAFVATLETPCEVDRQCLAIEIRFPKNYFEGNDDIQVPRPIYTRGCGNNKDSVNAKEFEKFEITFDPITNEYVVTHPCYTRDQKICCGTQTHCNEYRMTFPEELDSHKFVFYLTPSKKDTLVVIEDQKRYDIKNCQGVKDSVWGIGYVNGEPLFLREKFTDLPDTVFTTAKGFYAYHAVQVPQNYYRELVYLDRSVIIKYKKKSGVTDVGYWIPQFDYYIPFEQTSKKRYEKLLLDYSFQFRVQVNGEYYYLSYDQVKRRYSKRKNADILKIRKKDL